MNLKEINKLRDGQLTEEEILLLKLNLKMSYDEIGKHLGYTKQNVFYLLKRANKKIEQQKSSVKDENKSLNVGLDKNE